jgi:NAD(P)-dependent dehydrogenase (short-subunit alcohol dehydrogenase family)
MVAAVTDALGPIHVLHNNAASKSADLDAFFAPFERYALEEWRRIMAVNIDGMFLVAQAVGAQMVRQGGGGSVIQTSSIYGIRASDKRIYEGSHYLGRPDQQPGRLLGVEGRRGRAHAPARGRLGRPRHPRQHARPCRGGERPERGVPAPLRGRVPMGRMARAEEMVGALIFLASDASSYVTGQEIVVDGGLSAW